MKTLYIDCGMGVAGDMMSAALAELLPDKSAFTEKINSIGIPGIAVHLETDSKCGICGTHVRVLFHGNEESANGHRHGHYHGNYSDIRHIIAGLNGISQKVRQDITNIYSLLSEAESHVHGQPIEHIHFHELGTMDALADIAGVCILMDMLSPDKVVVSPVNTGSGHVKCAHGILPVPAPAAAYLLRGIPIYSGEIEDELCTPTGAALIKYFASSFGTMPEMTLYDIGYGLGTKDFGVANCLRMLMGETECTAGEDVVELCCNLDDMSPEDVSFVQKLLFESGALDVYTIALNMKKNRQGIMLCCLSTEDKADLLSSVILRYTTSWGVRIQKYRRITMQRSISAKSTPYGDVRIKSASYEGIEKSKPEYDDIEKIAMEQCLTPSQVRALLK